jgi:hypothetical protein
MLPPTRHHLARGEVPGLARRYLTKRGFLMRLLFNGGTLGGRTP